MKAITLLIPFFLCFSCQSEDPKTPTQEQQSIKISKDCQFGCENLSDIKCLQGNSIVECNNSCVQMMNHLRDKDPKCWAALISCDELEACRKN